MEKRFWVQRLDITEEHKETLFSKLGKINERNYKIFGIDEEKIVRSSKSDNNYRVPNHRRKASFSNGWYCYYTDNIDKADQFIYPLPILTVHGNPGDEKEWAALENSYNNRGRFINFIVPGYDKESEIRGDYSATWQDLSKMITLLMNHLKLDKIIYCAHSMGGLLMYNFCTTYPEKVYALIFMAAPPNRMYVGLNVFDGLARQVNYEKVKPNPKKLNDPEFRKALTKEFNEITKDIYFQTSA
jgi:pimeloyl-ACP methyl ester carboxylesterase